MNADLGFIVETLHVYKEYYEAEQAWVKSQDPSTPNEDFLPAAERFRKAKMAVKELRGE